MTSSLLTVLIVSLVATFFQTFLIYKGFSAIFNKFRTLQ
ncbi:hypothetical protein EDD79_1001124 [Serpentinicella alkaliphila]|uniref:Uncharacterized protein n=1 Tax=Serpentinicella alkaliphila TaxID=1734049 RepID=A0A4R2UCP4_9FIRM|nr:hypothetical protein EDD79_1001124 [Serpentinicella alkaliphila]